MGVQRLLLPPLGRPVARLLSTLGRNSFGSSLPEVVERAGWEGAWRAGVTPWETKVPHAVIAELLQSGSLPAGRVLVPGAGSGRDAFAFARAGRPTLVLDIAPSAVQECGALIGADPELRALRDAGVLEVRQGDFFALAPAPPDPPAAYSVVWDYTFMAALPVAARGEWARAMARLVAPGGQLLALLFPVGVFDGGPPFACDPAAVRDLVQATGAFVCNHLEPVPPPLSHKARAGREWLARFTRLPLA